MSVIEIKKLTRDYGNDKGIFNVSFCVDKGEVIGFLGANGAGKTTTIRHIMGFIDGKDTVSVFDQDSFKKASTIQKSVGYLAGEPVFIDHLTGRQFIDFMFSMKGLKDHDFKESLISYWEFDADIKISKMSKGMKQKVALVIAFMGNPPLIVLDEPTSGLDPLMQRKFVDLVENHKEKGATILMSSHMFEEVEHTCDRILMIKDGRIVADERLDSLRMRLGKHYEFIFKDEKLAQEAVKNYTDATISKNSIKLTTSKKPNEILSRIDVNDLIDLNIQPETLEEVFMKYYGGQSHE